MKSIASYRLESMLVAVLSNAPSVVAKIPFNENSATYQSCELANNYQTSTTLHEIDNLNLIVEKFFIVLDKNKLRQYLNENKIVVQVLLDAKSEILNRFGDVPVFLEIHDDKENANWSKLFMTVKNNSGSSVFETFIRKWYFAKDKNVKKLLVITED